MNELWCGTCKGSGSLIWPEPGPCDNCTGTGTEPIVNRDLGDEQPEEGGLLPVNDITISTTARDDHLQSLWEEIMDDGKRAVAIFKGVVNAYGVIGALSEQEQELWTLRIANCPDPEHGNRAWCAYCGDVSHLNEELVAERENATLRAIDDAITAGEKEGSLKCHKCGKSIQWVSGKHGTRTWMRAACETPGCFSVMS